MGGRAIQWLVLTVSLVFTTNILAHDSQGGTEKESVPADARSNLSPSSLQGSPSDHVISDGHGNCDSAELWSLRDKISQVKFDSLEKRVDKKFDSFEKRMDRWFYRTSRLEDRMLSLQLPHIPALEPNVTTAMEDMERRLADLEASKKEQQIGDEAQACERGMGDDLTKSYRPYIVVGHSSTQRQILCDTQTDGGGWVVIQRRAKGDIDFYRDWSAYREGFGPVTGDHWLGNEAIHKLTDEHPCELRIDLRVNGQELYAYYSSFRLESESDNYRLRLGSYSGTIGQASDTGLSYSINQPFTTFDRDNDAHSVNCAINHHGAWWYKGCHRSNLNGLWGDVSPSHDGLCWLAGPNFQSDWRFASFTEMKIRRIK